MAQALKISIVVPVYNVAQYITGCLESVIAQTWKGRMECILVDDCGTDDSIAIARRVISDYRGPIAFSIVSHQRNRGLSAARNTGLDIATGQYVYFLDSDDDIPADCIQRLAQPLAERDYDFIVGNYSLTGGDVAMNPLRLADGTVLKGDEVLRAYRTKQWYQMAWNKLFNVAFLNQHHLRFLEGIIYEDELWSFQVACVARSARAVGHVTYHYKLNGASITGHKDYDRSCRCLSIILQEMVSFARQHHVDGKADVHNLVQNFWILTLSTIHAEAPQLFPGFYAGERQRADISWTTCCRMDGLDLRKQLRDLHLLLPLPLALRYLSLLFRFL